MGAAVWVFLENKGRTWGGLMTESHIVYNSVDVTCLEWEMCGEVQYINDYHALWAWV